MCLSLRRANGSPVAACGSLVDCRCVGLTGCLSLRVVIWLSELAWDELTVVSIWLKTNTREVVSIDGHGYSRHHSDDPRHHIESWIPGCGPWYFWCL